MRRGQTALEYLMTYGWALLIIAIVAIALWKLGVFSPAKKPAIVQYPQYVELVGYRLVKAGADSSNITLELINSKTGARINITRAIVRGQFVTGGSQEVTVNEVFDENQRRAITLTVNGACTPGTLYTVEVTIYFKRFIGGSWTETELSDTMRVNVFCEQA